MTESALLSRHPLLKLKKEKTRKIHVILVQLPVAPHMDSIASSRPYRLANDVDGFPRASAGALMVGHQASALPTPHGCMKCSNRSATPARKAFGGHRSAATIVVKPMAMMLLARNPPSPSASARRKDLAALTRPGCLVVAAVGKRTSCRRTWSALCGDHRRRMNRKEDGKLAGDVDFDGSRSRRMINALSPAASAP